MNQLPLEPPATLNPNFAASSRDEIAVLTLASVIIPARNAVSTLGKWDTSGPKYQVNSIGEIEYMGPFTSGLRSYAPLVLNRSFAGTYLMRCLKAGPRSDSDYQLFGDIVATAAKLVGDRYHAPFSVLIWRRGDDPRTDRMLQVLTDRKIDVIDLAECPSALEINKHRIPHDGHPSAQAYELLATWLVEKLSLVSAGGE